MNARRILTGVAGILLAGVLGAGLIAVLPGTAGYTFAVVLVGVICGVIGVAALRGRGNNGSSAA
ncbi:MAG: hypothetical protein ACR2OB_09365 [Solirubrobacteraceae bacterium]